MGRDVGIAISRCVCHNIRNVRDSSLSAQVRTGMRGFVRCHCGESRHIGRSFPIKGSDMRGTSGRRRPRRRQQQTLFPPRWESLEDRRLLATFMVTSTADSGAGSLRQAILTPMPRPRPPGARTRSTS